MHARRCNLGEYMLHLSTDGEDAGSRVTERAAEQERRKVSIISDDSSFCARRMTARQAFVPAFRTHCACVQVSVFELQHFGCGCGCF